MSGAEPRSVGHLFRFKRWLTLSEAAGYLSLVLRENVGVDDVLRLGIDGHLTLSVRFVNGVKASIGKAIPIEEARHEVVPTLDGKGVFNLLEGVLLGPAKVAVFEPDIVGISDLWDLTMFGAERIDAERLFQAVTCGPEVDQVNLDGPIVRHGGIYCRLMTKSAHAKPRPLGPGSLVHPDDYYPASGLPNDSEIVVRPEALREFESLIVGTDETPDPFEQPDPAPSNFELPLGQRERTTLLLIVAALAELAKVDFRKPSSAAAVVEAQTELMGARVAARTIEGHLHRIDDALERRR